MQKKKLRILLFDVFFNCLKNNTSYHIPGSKEFSFANNFFKKFYRKHLTNRKQQLYLSGVNEFKYPFYKMGKVNSYDILTEPNEMVIFSLYSKMNKKNMVADLGANIGLHSIILGKMGYKVKAYEPNPDHVKQLKYNMKLNELKNVQVIQKAVDLKKHQVVYTNVLNNTTSSFIGTAKKAYGPIKRFAVQTTKFDKILKWADLIKMDIEGLEADILSKVNYKNIKNKKIIVEINNNLNAKKIFKSSKKNKFDILSQKNGWKCVEKYKDMPKSYKDGSAIIIKKGRKFEEIFE